MFLFCFSKNTNQLFDVSSFFTVLVIFATMQGEEKKQISNNSRKRRRACCFEEEKLYLSRDILLYLFPFLDSKEQATLLRTCQRINLLLNGYLERIVTSAKKETKGWGLLCLDTDYKDCFSLCVSFGLVDFLSHCKSLLGTSVIYRGSKPEKKTTINHLKMSIVRYSMRKDPLPLEVSSMHFEYELNQFGEESFSYEEIQKTLYGRTQFIKTVWEIEHKDLILSRLLCAIQHFGAHFELCGYGDLDDKEEFDYDQLVLISKEEGKEEEEISLADFCIDCESMDYGEEPEELPIFKSQMTIPPRVGSLLSFLDVMGW